MPDRQNLPTIGEIERAAVMPIYTGHMETSVSAAIALTVFEWHGEKLTKLTLHAAIGSQTMILDADAIKDLAVACTHAVEAVEG